MKKYRIDLDAFYVLSNRLINSNRLSMFFKSMLINRREKILGDFIDRVTNSLGLGVYHGNN